jgi:WD40 repeat protein
VRLILKWTASGNSDASQDLAFSPDGTGVTVARPGTIRLWNPATGKLLGGSLSTTENFLRIGHSLVALILAYLSGHFSGWVFARGRQPISSGDSHIEPAPQT